MRFRFRLPQGHNVFGHEREELPDMTSPPPSARLLIGLAMGMIVFAVVLGALVAETMH